jgi:hypothetical protein
MILGVWARALKRRGPRVKPAREAGSASTHGMDQGYRQDFSGNPVPVGAAAAIGASEVQP